MSDKSTNISILLLYALVVCLPFQSYMYDKFLGEGLNPINILMLLILGAMFSRKTIMCKDYKTVRILLVVFLLISIVSSAINLNVFSQFEFIVMWKRYFLLMLLVFVAYRVVSSEKEFNTITLIVSIATLIVAIQLLKNTYEYRNVFFKDWMKYGGVFGEGGENDLGAFLTMNFFWFLYWYFESRTSMVKAAAIFGGAVTLFACLFCFSRGAYVGLAGGVFWFGLRRSKLIWVVLLIAAITIPIWAPTSVKTRFDSLTDSNKVEKDASAQSRLILWGGALKMSADHPFIGVGPDNFSDRITDYISMPAGWPKVSHNMYLRYMAELGFIGGIVFFVLILSLIVKGNKLSKISTGWAKNWSTSYTSFIISVSIANWFGDRFIREELTGYIWIISGMMLKLLAMQGQEEQKAVPAKASSIYRFSS
ncbi:MAG: O-antigen ligase family protein [Deltaproteobacteria bacterium]|nr:O-antigen ligase family protein [Deltaproteobacteria bacterium]